MTPLLWLPSAEAALEEIVDYIAIDNLDAALKLGDQILSAVEAQLTHHPYSGRPGRVAGTRELVAHQNYIVIYQVRTDAVVVLDIIHAARFHPHNLL